jgi:integration host factor subunit alpha
MQKAHIAEEIKKQAGLTTRAAVEALESVLFLIKSTVQKGEDVSISGFGTFMVRSKRARPGRNPHTGQPVTIAARHVVTFKASALFKAYVNGDPTLDRTCADVMTGSFNAMTRAMIPRYLHADKAIRILACAA